MCTSPRCADAVDTLCNAPPSIGATCDREANACQGTGSIDGPVAPGCGDPQPGATCSCASGRYHCTQLARAADIQAALVGAPAHSASRCPATDTMLQFRLPCSTVGMRSEEHTSE